MQNMEKRKERKKRKWVLRKSCVEQFCPADELYHIHLTYVLVNNDMSLTIVSKFTLSIADQGLKRDTHANVRREADFLAGLARILAPDFPIKNSVLFFGSLFPSDEDVPVVSSLVSSTLQALRFRFLINRSPFYRLRIEREKKGRTRLQGQIDILH